MKFTLKTSINLRKETEGVIKKEGLRGLSMRPGVGDLCINLRSVIQEKIVSGSIHDRGDERGGKATN